MSRRGQQLLIAAACTLLATPWMVCAAGPSAEALTRGTLYEQRLGNQVGLALAFTDERGRTVRPCDYFRGRPVVLAMGYYRCPLLCGLGLNGTARTLEEFPPASPSRDFEFIFVSVDPTENYLVAAETKNEYLRKLAWKPAAERWHFLSGGEAGVVQLANQIGFHYRYDPGGKQYVHPSGLVVLSPAGRITSYLLGVTYPAADFERALANARRDEPGMVGEIISILCFSHDPVPGSAAYYVLMALRAGAILTLGGLVLLVRSKRRVATGRYSGA